MPGDTTKRDCVCPRARHQHGTYGAYRSDGCRCFACRFYCSRAGRNRRYDNTWVSGQPTSLRLRALAWQGWGAYTLGARLGVTHTMVEIWRAGRADVHRDTAATIESLYDELWNQTPPNKSGARRAHAHAVRAGWVAPLNLDDDLLRAYSEDIAYIGTECIDSALDDVQIGYGVPQQEKQHGTGDCDARVVDFIVENAPYLHNHKGFCTLQRNYEIDPVAVDRAMQGRRTPLTCAELSEAADTLTRMGHSAEVIADKLGVDARTIQRARARERAA